MDFAKFTEGLVRLQDRNAKYLYTRIRKTVSDIAKYHDNMSTTTVDPQRFRGRQVPRRDPEQLRNVYHYFHDVP